MHARAPILASAKLIASDAWNEPLRDTTLKHRRFIWATQFGVGSTGSNTRRMTIERHLAEAMPPGVIHARNEARRARNISPPRLFGAA